MWHDDKKVLQFLEKKSVWMSFGLLWVSKCLTKKKKIELILKSYCMSDKKRVKEDIGSLASGKKL
jgi:hypothetical protein